MFLSTNGGHTTVQKGLSRDTKCLHSTAEPSPYVCFSPSIEGESVMIKHVLLLPEEISKSTKRGKTKPTLSERYLDTVLYVSVF